MDEQHQQATSPQTAEPKALKILATLVSKLNLADFQNAIPIIHELRLLNETSERYVNATLTLTSSPEVFKPKTWRIEEIAPESFRSMPGLDLALDGPLLSRLTEAEMSTFAFVLEADGSDASRAVIAQLDYVVELLPRNQWGGLRHIPDMTAAFVQPNDPAVERLLKQAAELMRLSGKSPALDGYSGGPKRAWQLTSAVWGAVARMKLDYSLPPASFEQAGQKVRSPSQIADSGLATCMDLTLLLCAALEQVGLNPVIVFTHGHAFAGVWLKPEEFTTTFIDDVSTVRKRVKLKELALFETTLLTQPSIPPFGYAVERGAKQIDEDAESAFEMLLDIRRARLQRIKPLASAQAQAPRVGPIEPENPAFMAIDDGDDIPDDAVDIEVPDIAQLSPKDRLDRWQRKLLDLSLRNNLLNFKYGKKALKLEAPDPAALEDILASGQALRLLTRPDLMDGADPREKELYEQREREDVRRRHAEEALRRREVFIALSDREIDARLTELYRGARTALQEGGANTLFLAVGFLKWTREGKGGQKYSAPLLLIPVRLERKSARSGFSIVLHDEEPCFNPTLVEMLRQDFELGLGTLDTDLPRDGAGLDIAGIWRRVGHIIKDIAGWELTEDVTLAMFSFGKYLMWKDLAENAHQLRRSGVVQHLLDTPRDAFASAVPFPEAASLDRDYGPADVFCPLPSDSSQLAAVMAASRGKDFVLIGPPGTGKSQTIANMIAQSIAQGRRVLFVSEKIAALDVVYRRLREIGLGEFCLELHSSKARKVDVLAQLQSAWEAKGAVDTEAWQAEAQRLALLRDSLNLYVARLHYRYRNGYTLFDAIGTVTSGTGEPSISLTWPSPEIHDHQAMLNLREMGDRLEVNAQEVGYDNLGKHALSGIGQTQWSPHWRQAFVDAARANLPAVIEARRAVERYLELTGLTVVADSASSLQALASLSALLPGAAGHDWRFVLLPNARAISEQLLEGCTAIEKHRELTAELSPVWPSSLEDQATSALDLLQQRRSTAEALDPVWPAATLQALRDVLTKHTDIERLTERLSVPYGASVEALDIAALHHEWLAAEAALWPKSWMGKRRVSALLAEAQSGAGEADTGNDLATWLEIRGVQQAIEASQPGAVCAAFWAGARTAPAMITQALAFQEAVSAARADAAWSDRGFDDVEQGQLGDAAQAQLLRMRALQRINGELLAFAALADHTAGLWNGLHTDHQALAAALRFQTERRRIAEQGCMDDDHTLVEQGRCGPTLQRDHALLKARTASERAVADLAPLRQTAALWNGLNTHLDAVRQAVRFQGQLTAGLARLAQTLEQIAALKTPLDTLLGDGNALLEPEGAITQAGIVLRTALEQVETRTAHLTAVGQFTEATVAANAGLSLDALQQNCELMIASEPRLKAWCAWRNVRDEAYAYGLAPIVEAMEQGAIGEGRVRRVFEVNYARWWLNATVDNEAVIRTFVSAEHEQRIRDFRVLDDKFITLTRDWLRARLCADLPEQHSVSRSSEWGLLRHEMSKKTRHLPLRELMSQAPEALTKLTPCLLMSPLSIAQYLPANTTTFDLVIFDEASQIPVWDAIGAMARARQVVMVGDPKQLPPTSFFGRAESSSEDEDTEADLESILDECLSANLPVRNLNWHYRSRHESLIAFSNQRYYRSELVTFPSPFTKDKAVSLHPVAGVYDRGGSRTNRIEAQALVSHLVARLKSPTFRASGQTVGVVTLNGEQQKLIEDLLDQACRDEPALDSYFAESLLEPVFVKNLESVQGDERDIIYFSITFGKDAAGVSSMSFGPMNNQGGERRLNVAITRARQELVVFSSTRPEHMDLARTKNEGVRDLKHFLEFAERGAQALVEADRGSVGGFDSPFEKAVATELAKRGWQVVTQIGVSAFRIDLGIVDPDAPGRFLTGIECDGASYHRSATARDRDKLREFVLRGLGWEVVRVWSTDWWVDALGTADKVHQKLLELLDAARRKQAALEAAELAQRSEAEAAAAQALAEPQEPAESNAAPEQSATPGEMLEPHYAKAAAAGVFEVVYTSYEPASYSFYVEADPAQAVQDIDPERFFDTAYTPVLNAMIAHVVNEEGPILDALLARRIARAHGWSRTGSRIRELVDQLAREGFECHEEDALGTFFWPSSLSPGAGLVFRYPQQAEPGRNLCEVCLQEVVALVDEVRAQGYRQEALIDAVARAAGIGKLGHAVRLRIEQAMQAG